MTLYEIALDYAAHRAGSWIPLLICQRSDDGYGYRLVRRTSVLSVPHAPIDARGLSLLAWLFARHLLYSNGTQAENPREEAWSEAEDIYADLCLLTDTPFSSAAFLEEREAISTPPLAPAMQSA